MLHDHLIPQCYYRRNIEVKSVQLHRLCDASESPYAAVSYLRIVDVKDSVSTSLVIAKTKVAPIKRLLIPRLELHVLGAILLVRLISYMYVGNILQIPTGNIYAWTDSLVALSWLRRNCQQFIMFVGNHASEIIESIPPNCWQHVKWAYNPVDLASRGTFPTELN